MSSIPQQDSYQQMAREFGKMEQEKQQKSERRIKLGFTIFWLVDSITLVFSVIGYLIYTPITIDPSQAFRSLALASGILLVIGTIVYLAWMDLVKSPRYCGPY